MLRRIASKWVFVILGMVYGQLSQDEDSSRQEYVILRCTSQTAHISQLDVEGLLVRVFKILNIEWKLC